MGATGVVDTKAESGVPETEGLERSKVRVLNQMSQYTRMEGTSGRLLTIQEDGPKTFALLLV